MGLGSGIRDPGSEPEKTYSGSRIPDPGVKKAPDPGSGSATLLDSNPESCLSKQARYQHCHPSPYSTISSLLISRRCIASHKLMSTGNERRELNAGSRHRSHAAVSSRLCGGRGTRRLPGRAGGGPARPPAGGRDHPPAQ
jgi:hypothetical protein